MRRLLWIGGVAFIFLAIATLLIYRVSGGISSTVRFNSAKSTTATVVSVTEIPEANPSEDGNKLFRLCFSIDNFDQVDAPLRRGYQAAEARHLASVGPRCKVTAKMALAQHLHSGDKVGVIYLLENNYQINIVAMTAYGEDL
jgi:hypothetical protein